MEKSVFVTITGTTYCYGMKPFEIGRVLKLIKEPDNEYDGEAIRAELPFIDRIGYVANSPNTVAKGTLSAGRVYDLFETEIFAQVLFVTHASVICLLLIHDDGLAKNSTTEPVESGENASLRAHFPVKKHPIGF